MLSARLSVSPRDAEAEHAVLVSWSSWAISRRHMCALRQFLTEDRDSGWGSGWVRFPQGYGEVVVVLTDNHMRSMERGMDSDESYLYFYYYFLGENIVLMRVDRNGLHHSFRLAIRLRYISLTLSG